MRHRRSDGGGCNRRLLWRCQPWPVIERRFVAQLLDRQIGLDHAAVPDDKAQIVGGLANHGKVQPPFDKHRFRCRPLQRIEHHQHPLLAFRQQHFIGAHAGLAAGHGVKVEFDAKIALGPHFDGGRCQASRAHVLDSNHRAGFHQFQAGFQQQLFGKGIADLHRRAFFFRIRLEAGRGHAGPVDAVAAGFRAEIDDGVAHSRRRGIENLVRPGQPHRHGIDQDIAIVARVEPHRSADGRHAKGIAIAANASHHASQQMPGFRVLRRAKAQRIEAGDGARPHGEDIAQDSPDAGGRALVRLDERGVVVALHLENAGLAIADIDHPGIFPRPLDHPGGLCGQGFQVQPRGFIRAMLVPHGGKNAKLGEAGGAADQFQQALVFIRLQAVLGDKGGGDGGFWGHGGAFLNRRPA